MARVARRPYPLLHHSLRLYRPAMAVPPGSVILPTVPYEPDRVWIKGHSTATCYPQATSEQNRRGGGTVAHGHHSTPDPQATMAMSSVGLSGMLNSHFLRSADRPLLPFRP